MATVDEGKIAVFVTTISRPRGDDIVSARTRPKSECAEGTPARTVPTAHGESGCGELLAVLESTFGRLM